MTTQKLEARNQTKPNETEFGNLWFFAERTAGDKDYLLNR